MIQTALRRYVIDRGDVLSIRLVTRVADFLSGAEFDRPCLGIELGPLLDPSDHSTLTRRRALVVPLRRRYIAFMVDYIDTLPERISSIPLPSLLRERLQQPWAVGALVIDADLIVQLDLRAVARSVLMQKSGEN